MAWAKKCCSLNKKFVFTLTLPAVILTGLFLFHYDTLTQHQTEIVLSANGQSVDKIDKSNSVNYGKRFPKATLLPDLNVSKSLESEFVQHYGRRPCTLGVLHQYERQYGFHPMAGQWHNVDRGYPHAQYWPHICSLHQPGKESNDLMLTFLKRMNKVTKILTIGDSQGQRYSQAITRLLQGHGYVCKTLKVEQNTYKPGKGYFLQGTNINSKALVASSRTCHTCMSNLQRCDSSRLNNTVMVEYVSMMMVAQDTIVANKAYCQDNQTRITDPVCGTNTQQEFLFKVYLKDNYPDLLFMFGTFGHDFDRTLNFIRQALCHIVSVIHETLPSSSKVIWFGGSAMYTKHGHDIHKNDRYEYGWTVDQKVQACNLMQFQEVYSLMEKKVKMFGYFDLHSMSLGIQDKFHEDHVHFIQAWYDYVVFYLFSMLASR